MIPHPPTSPLFPYTTLFRSTLTNDPITAMLQQLADHHDQLTQLTELITGIGDTLREHQAALETLAQTPPRSEEHTSELQSHVNLVCRLLLEKKNKNK